MPVWPKFEPQSFYKMLDIVVNYHRTQFHGKRKIQTQENEEKPHFGPDLGHLCPNLGR